MDKANNSSSNTFRSSPDHIPARMLNQFAYCPRLAFIEWVNGEFEQNVFTVEGKQLHRRVDAREDPLPDADADVDKGDEPPGRSRSVMLSSDRVGAIARMDIVETEGRVATPVDFKRSLYLDADGGLPIGDCVQLCVQGLILRDHGFQCDQGVLYYADVRRRHQVAFDDRLVTLTERMLSELREVAESG